MTSVDLWKKYCSYCEKPFSEQIATSKHKMKEYFEKWKKKDLYKEFCADKTSKFKDVPITDYRD